jgi:hypothetical protein
MPGPDSPQQRVDRLEHRPPRRREHDEEDSDRRAECGEQEPARELVRHGDREDHPCDQVHHQRCDEHAHCHPAQGERQQLGEQVGRGPTPAPAAEPRQRELGAPRIGGRDQHHPEDHADEDQQLGHQDHDRGPTLFSAGGNLFGERG